MPVIPAELAFLKTTDEPCFVLETRHYHGGDGIAKDDAVRMSGEFAIVRRPVATENGTQHVTETFHIEELESFEDRKARAKAEQEAFKKELLANKSARSEEPFIN